jgi:hypothetical protein
MPETAESRLEQQVLARFGLASGVEWEYPYSKQPVAVGRFWAGSDSAALSKAEDLRLKLVRSKVSREAGRLVVQGALSDLGPREGIAVVEVFTAERPD